MQSLLGHEDIRCEALSRLLVRFGNPGFWPGPQDRAELSPWRRNWESPRSPPNVQRPSVSFRVITFIPSGECKSGNAALIDLGGGCGPGCRPLPPPTFDKMGFACRACLCESHSCFRPLTLKGPVSVPTTSQARHLGQRGGEFRRSIPIGKSKLLLLAFRGQV